MSRKEKEKTVAWCFVLFECVVCNWTRGRPWVCEQRQCNFSLHWLCCTLCIVTLVNSGPFLLSAVWLWILMDPLSGSYNCFNKGVRQEQRPWRRRAQHGHTGYKRDQTCDLLTIGQSVTAGPPCHFKNVLQTLEEPGIEPQWGYFQVCDLNNCIYRTLETERLNWKKTKTRQDAREKKKICAIQEWTGRRQK